jgi:D-serine deaminase-like pyridoxal phosphate-dependent protein
MQIQKPTLLLNSKKCKANIKKMAEKAFRSNTVFRPHFKTHQSHEIGQWFRAFGVSKITVSSVQMAQYFAEDGWDDITIAFPFNILEIEAVNELTKSISLNILIESAEVINYAEKHLSNEVGVFIKIDAGYHRTGILLDDSEKIDQVVKLFKSTKKCKLKGFLVHNGNTYKASSVDRIKNIHLNSTSKLNALKKKYRESFPYIIISVGDTPSMSVVEDLSNIDEIRPGNFVFYDLMQSELGVCRESDIAIVLACPVVAKHEGKDQIIIYGGAVHLSKEALTINNIPYYGKMTFMNEYKWKLLNQVFPVVSLSQEHGIIQLDESTLKKINIGDVIGVIPVHSCLTAHLSNYFIKEDSSIISKY